MFYNVRRKLSKSLDQIFHRLGYKDFRRVFDQLGIERGNTVCVHSALRNLGYIDGGPLTLVRALQDAVGKEGCILMPTFPFSATMLEFLDGEQVFDVKRTPSKVGALTEFFRRQEGVRRSLHPTHAVAGWGDKSEKFLDNHERSETPFGLETPYGHLAEDDDAYMLMLETRLLSLPHHLQERVSFPNLFLPKLRKVPLIDYDGRYRTISTKVMRPKIPYFVAIPPVDGDKPEWCIVHDFCLLFPEWRKREVRNMGFRMEGYPPILTRRTDLARTGILRTASLGKGEIGLLRVARFIRKVEPELVELLQQFVGHYSIENIAKENDITLGPSNTEPNGLDRHG